MNMDDLMEQLDEALEGGLKIPGKRTMVDTEKIRAMLKTLPASCSLNNNVDNPWVQNRNK